MKSDWHRYNLKRRVASLPPISADVFTEKVLQARAATTAEADKAYFEQVCEVCEKTYYSQNAYQNHLSSQKHKLKEASSGQAGPKRADDENTSVVSSTFSLGEPLPTSKSGVDSDAEEEFSHVVEGLQNASLTEQKLSPVKRPSNPQPADKESPEDVDAANDRGSNSATPVPPSNEPEWTLESCLFCNYSSPSVTLNTNHMERFHGMFIPEKTYLVDLDGLLKQLQNKIRDSHQCLYCDKFKTTTFAVQTHMRDKGHCKIPFETEAEQLEIGDFYDFRSTYSDGEESEDEDAGDDTNGGAKLGARRASKIVNDDGEEIDEGEEGEGWETDSSASSLDSEDLTAVPAEGHIHQFERLGKHPHHSHHDPRHRHQADGWHSHAHKHTHAVFHDEYELHLPSGKSVGHRSLNKYFRQNLHSHPSPEERAERLAIEEGEREEGAGGETGDGQLVHTNGNKRQMVPRGVAGMTGVSDQKRRDVARAEQRGRAMEQNHSKKKDWVVGNKLNNHQSYYYREKGGG